jgi:hypothetical protein
VHHLIDHYIFLDFCRKASDQSKRVATQKLERETQLPAVNCNALSGFVIMFHRYDYFSQGLPFFKIPESLRDFT